MKNNSHSYILSKLSHRETLINKYFAHIKASIIMSEMSLK